MAEKADYYTAPFIEQEVPSVEDAAWAGLSRERVRLNGRRGDRPRGRGGIAETVAFLASDGAAYITGQNIVIAGGAGLST